MSAGDVSNSEFVGNLYRGHHGQLLTWLNRNLGCRQCVEGLSQGTFVCLLGRPELPGLREPHAFLVKATRGLMIDHLHHAVFKQIHLTGPVLVPEVEQPSAEGQYLTLENLREIGHLLGTLSLKARSVFLYSRLDDVPHTGIVECLGISVPYVCQYLAQGLRQYYIALYGEPR